MFLNYVFEIPFYSQNLNYILKFLVKNKLPGNLIEILPTFFI